MKFITPIIAALLFLSVPAFAAEAVQEPTQDTAVFVALTPNVTVTEGVVRLGDIFNGAGEYAHKVVAYAPRPGGRAVFDARWLLRVANAYKLNWRPSSNTDRVEVERASRLITKDDIEALLQQRYIEDGGDSTSRARISNRLLSLHLPLTDATVESEALNVAQMTVDADTGRFTAVVSWGNATDERTRIAGRVERMTQVPVLTGRIMRGEIIDEADVVWQNLTTARLPHAAITDADMIIGMAAKRALQAGTPIAANDVRRPLLVNRGETVTMTLSTPSMQLTAKGRALQHGSEGDTIRISNLQSNTVVDAIVTGPGQARVETSVNLAMR